MYIVSSIKPIFDFDFHESSIDKITIFGNFVSLNTIQWKMWQWKHKVYKIIKASRQQMCQTFSTQFSCSLHYYLLVELLI